MRSDTPWLHLTSATPQQDTLYPPVLCAVVKPDWNAWISPKSSYGRGAYDAVARSWLQGVPHLTWTNLLVLGHLDFSNLGLKAGLWKSGFAWSCSHGRLLISPHRSIKKVRTLLKGPNTVLKTLLLRGVTPDLPQCFWDQNQAVRS